MTETNTQSPCAAQAPRKRDILLVASSPRQLRMSIIRQVADSEGVTVADIMGRSQAARYVVPRWRAMAAVKAAFPQDSVAGIGRLFGRDHTSVMHALRKVMAL